MKSFPTFLAVILILAVLASCSANYSEAPESKAAPTAIADIPSNTVPVQGSASSTVRTTADMISRDRAIEIALSHAALSRDAVFSVEAEVDRERNLTVWDVEFEDRDHEYSYYIDAHSGEIIRSEKDIDR